MTHGGVRIRAKGRKRPLAGEMIHSSRIAILNSLLVGLAATLGTIVIHGFVVHIVTTQLHRDLQRGSIGVRLSRNLTFGDATTMIALAGHLLEIALWALVLDLCGGAADFITALYCSAGSYTTVGSGDVVLSSKLLGPFEAATGMLMFGVSPALIFAVIQRLIQARLDRAKRR
jgi:Ion channel